MSSHAGPLPLFNKTKLSLSGGSTTGAYAHPSPPWATTVRSIDNSDSRKSKFQKIGLQNSPQNAQNAFSHNLISFDFSGEHAPGLPPLLNLAPLAPVNPQTHPLELKLVYELAKIFGSDKPICLKVEDSKWLANGRSRVGPSPLFNFFFLAMFFTSLDNTDGEMTPYSKLTGLMNNM